MFIKISDKIIIKKNLIFYNIKFIVNSKLVISFLIVIYDLSYYNLYLIKKKYWFNLLKKIKISYKLLCIFLNKYQINFNIFIDLLICKN
jgi:hypothetical protein